MSTITRSLEAIKDPSFKSYRASDAVKAGIIPRYVGQIMVYGPTYRPEIDQPIGFDDTTCGGVTMKIYAEDRAYKDPDTFEAGILKAMGYTEVDLPKGDE